MRSPSATIVASSRPVIAAACDGGNARMRSLNSGQPRVWFARYSRSSAPRVDDHVAAGRARARRRCPGSGARCSSACAAVRVLQRVDRDDVRALLARLEDELPQVVAARQRVRAPQQDQLRVLEGLGVHPGRGAGHVGRALAARDAAGGHVVARRAEHVPQPLAGAALEALDVAERARPLERPDRLAAELVADRVQLGRRSSASASSQPIRSKLPLALAADALERVQEPVRRPGVLEIAVDLGAQRARGERMLAVALEVDGAAPSSSTVTTQLHPSGQSSGQAPRTSCMPPGYVIAARSLRSTSAGRRSTSSSVKRSTV